MKKLTIKSKFEYNKLSILKFGYLKGGGIETSIWWTLDCICQDFIGKVNPKLGELL